MKKILIISRCLEIGGAEKALIGLLKSINYEKYAVDLFLQSHNGILMDAIPSKVNLLPTNNARYLGTPLILTIKDHKWGMFLGRVFAKIHANIFNIIYGRNKENHIESTLSHLYTYKFVENINSEVEYDLAISFLTPHYICMHKCNAKKKIAWIHTDYSSIITSNKIELKMWEKYDYIASISNSCSKAFIQRFPTLKNKIVGIDNIITKDMIMDEIKNADAYEIDKTNNHIILCSVGRLSTAKNFDNVPEICRLILNYGIDIKWYIIGNGGIKEKIKENIRKFSVENNVFLLGEKKNPYPYIEACEFYVQPSRYEGKAVTVREAQILCKPVIITDFPTAKSQLKDGYDGVIVPMDNKGCAEGIVNFINNKELQKKIIDNLKQNDYSNADEIKKIYDLIGDDDE